MIELEDLRHGDAITVIHSQVHEVRADWTQAGGYSGGGTAEVNDAFRKQPKVGIYLPSGVSRFSVTIDVLFHDGCSTLTGSGIFDVGAADPVLSLVPVSRCAVANPDAPVDGPDGGQSDATDSGSDASDSGSDASDTSETPDSDHVDCDGKAPPAVCFDPDAGTAMPFPLSPTNSECGAYCNDVTSACPKIYADGAGCMTVCTQAGWHLPGDGSSEGTTLSCLAGNARAASANVSEQFKTTLCSYADPRVDSCGPSCDTYCTLRRTLCQGNSQADPNCLGACNSLAATKPDVVTCLVGVMEHDVPNDVRYCEWAELSVTCGRCLGP